MPDETSTCTPQPPATAAEGLARRFHEIYERLAPEYSYETRKASAVPWEQVPENNRALMIAVSDVILRDTRTVLTSHPAMWLDGPTGERVSDLAAAVAAGVASRDGRWVASPEGQASRAARGGDPTTHLANAAALAAELHVAVKSARGAIQADTTMEDDRG